MSSVLVHREERWKRSPITQTIVDRLRNLKEDEVIDFEELSELTHQRVSASNHYWHSAVRIVQKEYQIVVKPLTSYTGARRLTNDEISKISTTEHLKKLKSSTRKMSKQVDTVVVERLDRERLNEYANARSYEAMTKALTSKPVNREIERQSTQFNPTNELANTALLKALAGLWKKPKSENS